MLLRMENKFIEPTLIYDNNHVASFKYQEIKRFTLVQVFMKK